ncbi:MAG: hypothetical protein Q9164_003888 [Protoblastenia rupestris]
MAFSSLSPIPSFPPYTGPYTVGTQDVEIPISELPSFVPAPDPSISTINFRLFYPCEKQQLKRAKSVYWLPEPQNEYWRAYARFLQAGPWLATILSYIPVFRLINHSTIPVVRNAKPLIPPHKNNGRWPVTVFSHGLGGSKNAYSHICGSLASHGLVVVAPDHRDGSTPISFVKDSIQGHRKAVNYESIAHESSPEVEEARNLQLRIRCWELGLVYEALLKIDGSGEATNTLAAHASDDHLSALKSLLDVHNPGQISWAGHSFGATTIVQFVKSVFYGGSPLFTAPSSSQLSRQIKPASPITLLDLWTLPLLFPSASNLWAKPLPAYSGSGRDVRASASPPLAILSEAFYKWSSNLRTTIQAVSPSSDTPLSNENIKPSIFYPKSSAHLSQSDFGILFSRLTKRLLKAEEPERTMRLNVRAILESLRRSGIPVAETSKLDMEIHEDQEGAKTPEPQGEGGLAVGQDHKILATDGNVRGWIAIDPEKEQRKFMLNGHAKEHDKLTGYATNGHATNGHVKEPKGPDEAVMQNEVMKS